MTTNVPAVAATTGHGQVGLVTAVALVTFSDLAFGWSTTLDVPAATATRIVQGIAAPWASFAPLAVPSPELVEQSQFFRLERTGVASGAARALGAWWPFTVLAVVTYGLLPRLLLLALTAARLRTATGALLLEDARVTALLDRMASPAIETAAAHLHEERVEARGGRLVHDPVDLLRGDERRPDDPQTPQFRAGNGEGGCGRDSQRERQQERTRATDHAAW